MSEEQISKSRTLVGNKAESYVNQMAHNLGLDPSSSAVKEIAVKAKDLTFNQTNKEMFALLKAEGKKKPKELSREDVSNLTLMGRSRQDDMAKQHEDAIRNYLDDACDYARRANEELQNVARENKKLLALKKTVGVDFCKQVLEVVQNPFFHLHKVNQDEIHFTTNNVLINYENKSAGVKYEIDLGKYLVVLKPNIGECNIYPFEDNLLALDRFPHPHIRDKNGSMCWGNAFDSIARMSRDFDIRPAMTAIEAFLLTYNDQSPFADIQHFAIARDNKPLLVGKKGGMIFDKNDSRIFIGYINVTRLNRSFLPDLAVRGLKIDSSNYMHFFYYSKYGASWVELNDGSFISLNRFTGGNSISNLLEGPAPGSMEDSARVKGMLDTFKADNAGLNVEELDFDFIREASPFSVDKIMRNLTDGYSLKSAKERVFGKANQSQSTAPFGIDDMVRVFQVPSHIG